MQKDGPALLVLSSANTSLVLEARTTEAPLWRYWGPRLEAGAEAQLGPLRDSLPAATFSLETPSLFSLFPTFGLGWYGAPALLAHRQGADFAQDFTRCTWDWQTPGRAITFTLLDEVAQLSVLVQLELDDDGGLVISTILTNLGPSQLDVQWLASACLPLPSTARTVRSYGGRHNSEFQLSETPLGRASWLQENRRGLTSHECVPAGLVLCEGATPHAGSVYGAQLAWSGNHSQRIDWLEDGRYQWQLGLWLAPGEGKLDPGATLQAPPVLATVSDQGLNGVAQGFHRLIRKQMTWPGGAMKPRLIHLNTWEGLYFNLDEAALFDMAQKAADLGVERFVLDDGWFKGRRDDTAGLGDWWVDEGIFKRGLGPLARHVTGLGMEFGLWVEPEMVNPDSDLFLAHPDWALQIKGRPHLTARNQLVLDLSRAEVFDYLASRLEWLLETLPISYLKWDHNRALTAAAGAAGTPAYVNQVNSAYRLFDHLRQKWPDLEIEACAGGGGRIDAGILAHTHRVWTSDCLDGLSRLHMQRAFLQFFPPEIMGSHIGAAPAHATGRTQSFDFRGAVALPGHFGLELDPRHLPQKDEAKVRAWVGIYKTLREHLHTHKVWLGEAGDGIFWQAHGSTEHSVIIFYRAEPSRQTTPPQARLPFLDAAADYSIEQIFPAKATKPNDPTFFKDLVSHGQTLSGGWLKHAGLPIPATRGEAAWIVRLTKL